MANLPGTILALVSTGAGITLLPESLSRIAWPDVIFKSISGEALHADLHLYVRQGDTSVALSNFVEMARQKAKVAS
jgi:DNA-binding transcriptional LysR family regulator